MLIKGLLPGTILYLFGFVSSLTASGAEDKIISIKSSYYALTSTQQVKENLVISDEESWRKMLQGASLQPDLRVDFQTEMVLASFLGECPSDGYEIKIYQVSRTGQKIEARIGIGLPITGEHITRVKTSPLHLVVIERNPLPVEFVSLDKEIRTLIEKLGDDAWQIREEATQQLSAVGKPAVPYLLEAVHHPDAEVRMRTSLILKEVMIPVLMPMGWVGVTLQQIEPQDPRLAGRLSNASAVGVEISEVIPGQPSEKYGLKQNDIIIALDGQAFSSTDHLIQQIGERKPGTKIELTLIRGDAPRAISVILGQRPAEYRSEIDAENLWQTWWEKIHPEK
jgi:hypothetical protein